MRSILGRLFTSHTAMNDLPETPREIARAKVQLFRRQSEFIRAKDEVNNVEREWLAWSVNRITELEAEQ